jgi:rhamnosyltransferase
MMTGSSKIGAVIVAWRPDHEDLANLTQSLQSQVDHTIIVDNTQPPVVRQWAETRADAIEIIDPGANIGVAAAINLGVARLLDSGCTHALLLDQDSLPADDMVSHLANRMQALENAAGKIAAIAPSVRDRTTGQRAPFVRFRLPMNRHLHGQSGVTRCDFLITSGKLLNLRHWAEIGPMREPWFIDSIDLEWCFRARRKGYGIYGSFDTELLHSIGENRRLWPGRLAPVYRHHSSDRLYTMMRNRVFLYRTGAPIAWTVHDLIRSIGKLALFSLIPPRGRNIKAMLRGLKDGLTTHPVP